MAKLLGLEIEVGISKNDFERHLLSMKCGTIDG